MRTMSGTPVICLTCGLLLSALLSASAIEVSRVEVEGNDAFSDKKIKSLMVTHPSGFLSSYKFSQPVFEDDLEAMLVFYQYNGYLDVSIPDTTLEITPDSTLAIKVTISEGPLYKVEGIEISGNTVFDDTVLLGRIALAPGDPYSQPTLETGMFNLAQMYADTGYLEANITPDVTIRRESNRVLVSLTLQEGNQSSVSEIEINGLDKIEKHVVRRELTFDVGEIVNYSELMRSQRRLYMTGLFKSVFIEPKVIAGDPASRVIVVDAQENLSSEFNALVGYGSIEKLRGSLELFTSNLAGTSRQLGGKAHASFHRRALEGSFTEPWTLGTRLRTDINALGEFVEEPGYDVGRFRSSLTVGRDLGRHAHVSLTYRFENARITHVEIDSIPENLDPRVRSLILTGTYDTRDDFFSPTRGVYLEWSNELAGSFLQGNNSFARSVVRMKWFAPWGRKSVLGVNAEIGWMDYIGSSGEVPISERFYTGGPNTIRGFGYQEVGELDSDGDPLGGQFMVLLNGEIRRHLWKAISGVLFVDGGFVWSRVRSFQFGDMRTSPGFGIRAATPIGIARLDLGINPDKRPGESRARLYISMGHAF